MKKCDILDGQEQMVTELPNHLVQKWQHIDKKKQQQNNSLVLRAELEKCKKGYGNFLMERE